MTSGGTWWTASTRLSDWAVTAVTTHRASTEKSVRTRRSRLRPAPPLESVAAITRTEGRDSFEDMGGWGSVAEGDQGEVGVAALLEGAGSTPRADAGAAAEDDAGSWRQRIASVAFDAGNIDAEG
jgi:hypothetical protein